MARSFCFIGDPGSGRGEVLRVLRESGLEPRRVDPRPEGLDGIEEDPPVAIAIGSSVENRSDVMAALQERKGLARVPVLAHVDAADPRTIKEVFDDGVDDYLVDGDGAQLTALTAFLQRSDTWRAVRAPAGMVVLAEADRLERVRLARVLRRNGFDIWFAASSEELAGGLTSRSPRAVIASAGLSGRSPAELVRRATNGKEPPPWVILASGEEVSDLRRDLQDRQSVAIFESGGDAERLTFVMNELLSPLPPNVRRTPRLLYGTPVSFRPEGSVEAFHGYTYNVNLGGLFVRTLVPMPLHSRVAVRFRPPYGRGEVEAVAQVAWRREFSDAGGAASPAGMGVQFVEWMPADKAGFEAGYEVLREEHEARVVARNDEKADRTISMQPAHPAGTGDRPAGGVSGSPS